MVCGIEAATRRATDSTNDRLATIRSCGVSVSLIVQAMWFSVVGDGGGANSGPTAVRPHQEQLGYQHGRASLRDPSQPARKSDNLRILQGLAHCQGVKGRKRIPPWLVKTLTEVR